jgi:hypothetical protein
MVIHLDVEKAVEELQRAASELQSNNYYNAIINAESALSRIASYAQGREIIVTCVPNPACALAPKATDNGEKR